MGQRHQLFIIARILGRYRGLAALHHQWSYGSGAVARCSRLLEVFQAPENRIPIQQELLGARSRDEAFWNQKFDYAQDDYARRVAPFPFISTALILGGSFDPDKGKHSRVHPLDFNTPFDEGDNNDGVTIIDITEQAHPRYCFVFFNDIERDYEDDNDWAKLRTPLSASSYLEVYRESPTELLQKMNTWPLVDVGALDNAWPGGGWSKLSDGDEDVQASRRVEARSDQLTNIEQLPDIFQAPTPLKDVALERLIQSALEGSEIFPESLRAASSVPDFRQNLRARLCEKAENQSLDAAPSVCLLISTAYEKEENVDMSHFRSFPSTALCQIIAQLQKVGLMKSLNVSNCSSLTADGLASVLDTKTTLSTLYTLETPRIPLETVVSLNESSSNNIHTIYHTELFQRPLQSPPASRHEIIKSPETAKFVGTNSVSNLIAVTVSKYDIPNISKGSPRKYLDWSKLGFPKLFETLGNCCVFCPLDDVPLPTVPLVSGFMNYLRLRSRDDSGAFSEGCGAAASAVAKSFAMAFRTSDEVGKLSTCRVGPLPAALFSAVNLAESIGNPPWPLELPVLKPNQWSILLIHENVINKDEDTERFRYAMISPVEETSVEGQLPMFRVIDMESFLKMNVAKSDHMETRFWEEHGASLTETIGEQEVQELMPLIREELQRHRDYRLYDHRLR